MNLLKRFAATLAAFVFGFAVTWVSLYTLSRVHLPRIRSSGGGCDLEHNPTWWCLPAFMALLFLPSICFAAAGYLAAARAWPIRKVAKVFAWMTGFTVFAYIVCYVL